MLESLEGSAAKCACVRRCRPSRASSDSRRSSTTSSPFRACPHPQEGAAFYRDFGVGKSRGTLPFQLAGNMKQGGLVERAFGLSLKELLYDYGGGSATGRPIRTVQVGGPLGAFIPACQFDAATGYEALTGDRRVVGSWRHRGLRRHGRHGQMARFAMEFCAIESCGKCTPCRIGSTRGVEVIDRILAGVDRRHI